MDAVKYLKQLAVIMTVSFLGELLNKVLPLPVPGSVYGLLLMLFCLLTGAIKLEQVEDAGDFLIKLMPVLFIGPSVSLITVMGGLADQLVPILAVCMISTVVVMVATGLVAQAVLKWMAGRQGADAREEEKGRREEPHE